jgi:hypothetical protein
MLSNKNQKADSDLEYIRRNMQQLNLGNHSLEVSAVREEKIRDHQEELIKRQNERSNAGYMILLTEAFRRAKEGLIALHDDLEQEPIEKFIISPSAQETLKSSEKLQNFFDKGGKLQQLYGYSDNVMLTFYEIAKGLLIEKRGKDALHAFTFLCDLNPQICSFWIGLGLSFEAEQNWPETIEAYEMAIYTDPLNFDPYLGLLHCCQELKDYSRIKEVLPIAAEEESLKEQVQEAFAYIAEQEKEDQNA